MNETASDAQRPRACKPRRAAKPAPAGVDPHPSDHSLTSRAGEDQPGGWGEATTHGGSEGTSAKHAATKGENDDRLKRDRPPHWA